jgi:hypothetical protein
VVGVVSVALQGAKNVGREPAVTGAGFDEIEILNSEFGIQNSFHLGDLLREQLAEQRTDVDAGKKIARASRTLNGAGVVTEIGVIQGGIHERSHGDRAALTDPGLKIRQSYSLRTVTKTSLSPRQISTRAIRPLATFCNSRPASDALEIF